MDKRAAIASASSAFAAWADLPYTERAHFMLKIADEIERRRDDLDMAASPCLILIIRLKCHLAISSPLASEGSSINCCTRGGASGLISSGVNMGVFSAVSRGGSGGVSWGTVAATWGVSAAWQLGPK